MCEAKGTRIKGPCGNACAQAHIWLIGCWMRVGVLPLPFALQAKEELSHAQMEAAELLSKLASSKASRCVCRCLPCRHQAVLVATSQGHCSSSRQQAPHNLTSYQDCRPLVPSPRCTPHCRAAEQQLVASELAVLKQSKQELQQELAAAASTLAAMRQEAAAQQEAAQRAAAQQVGLGGPARAPPCLFPLGAALPTPPDVAAAAPLCHCRAPLSSLTLPPKSTLTQNMHDQVAAAQQEAAQRAREVEGLREQAAALDRALGAERQLLQQVLAHVGMVGPVLSS